MAGTVLVHKIAGAAAAMGQSLVQVRDVARRVASRMGTLGFALDSVTIPGALSKNDRLNENTIEIGLGIHGEAGTYYGEECKQEGLASQASDLSYCT